MSIDFQQERLITLTEAANRVPWGKVHPQTVIRWYRVGVRGVKLATVLCGRRYTSAEALLRFLRAIDALDQPPAAEDRRPARRQPTQRPGRAVAETLALHKAIGLDAGRRRGA